MRNPFLTLSAGDPSTGNRQMSDCMRTRLANSFPGATMSGSTYDTSPNVSCRSGPPFRDTVRRLKIGGYAMVLPADEAYTRPEPSGSHAIPCRLLARTTTLG